MEKLINIFLKIFAVFTALGFLLLLGGGIINPHPSGTRVTQYFLDDLKTEFICKGLTDSGILMLLFFGAGLGVLLFVTYGPKEFSQAGFRTVLCCSMLGLMGLIFFFGCMSRVVPVIGHEPRVVSVTVVDKSTRIGGGKSSHRTHYYLHFSNGSKRSVDYDAYLDAVAGDSYYVVMCDHTALLALNPDEYTIDRSLTDGGT